MHISWLGNTAVKIQTKPADKEVIIVIDPYKPEQGAFPRNLAPDIGLYTRGKENSITLSDNAFILSDPGECETNGVLITAIEGDEPGKIMFRIDSEQLSAAHLGLCKKPLNDRQLEALSNVDILFIPVGGNDGYEPDKAVEEINDLEPKIVIPIACQSDNDPKAKPVSSFLKAMGIRNGKAPEKKIIIKKKDLPAEDTQVMVLGKE